MRRDRTTATGKATALSLGLVALLGLTGCPEDDPSGDGITGGGSGSEIIEPAPLIPQVPEVGIEPIGDPNTKGEDPVLDLCHSDRFYVNRFDDFDDGSPCDAASCSLRQALRMAVECGVQRPESEHFVVLQDGPGRYQLTLEQDLTPIREPASVVIVGNGATVERVVDPSRPDFRIDPGASLVVRKTQIVAIRIENAGVTRIEKSSVERAEHEGDGGAIHNASGAELQIVASSLAENMATATYSSEVFVPGGLDKARGGAIYNEEGGTVTIENSELRSNAVWGRGPWAFAVSRGGAIYNSGSLAVRETRFSRNTARVEKQRWEFGCLPGQSYSDCLVMHDYWPEGWIPGKYVARFIVRTFSDAPTPEENRRDMTETELVAWTPDGGAIFMASTGTASIERSSFEGNVADRSGGAIANEGGVLDVLDTTFRANEAGYDGGALLLAPDRWYEGEDIPVAEDNAFVEGSTFVANRAGAKGGAIAMGQTWPFDTNREGWVSSDRPGPDPSLLLDRSTLSGNVAQNVGGGMSVFDARTRIQDATITGNQVETWDEAANQLNSWVDWVYNDAGDMLPSAGLYAAGGALLGNTIVAGNPGGDCFGSEFVELGSSLDSDGSCDVGVTAADPGLAPLADNGGPTDTHAITMEGPARDAGSSCLEIDQRGLQRGPDACDIGAFELRVLDVDPDLDACMIDPAGCDPVSTIDPVPIDLGLF